MSLLKYGKIGHSKNKYSWDKHTKKVNYTYLDEPKNFTSEEIPDEKTKEEISVKTDPEGLSKAINSIISRDGESPK
ncbi:hypothetical protein C1645_836056 [Glomus cerebriforme]|uniref:Uncharacterized protein n=1 Tax=Glomus cerebriforme TaxID=658196 RepID=A0A397SB91_9GLOM|nr:hypothetical protein C1645_836056 [Glomus cerebriforme]